MSELITEREIAKQLHVSLALVRRWRVEKRGPTFIKVGPLVRYRPEDVQAWLTDLPKGGSRQNKGTPPSASETLA